MCIYDRVCVFVWFSGECVSRLISGLSVHQTSFLKIDNLAADMHTTT